MADLDTAKTETPKAAAAEEPSDTPKFAQIPGIDERRKTARKAFFVMGQIAIPQRGSMAVRYLDISTGGVGLVSDLNIPARTRVHLKFTIMMADSSLYPFVVQAEVAHPRGARSLSSHLKSRLNLTPLHMALLHEVLSKEALHDPYLLAAAIQHLPITLAAPRPLDEAISSAGGVCLEDLDTHLMVTALPGLFVAGEMLDWEAPTGGYLLSAGLASGRLAGLGAVRHLLGKAAMGEAALGPL
jgi:hypothetical protein